MRKREIVLSEIKAVVAKEREYQLRVLHLLREVERDRHLVEMGYPNLFDFAVGELGYSPSSAQRRIQAMRLLKVMPEIEPKLEEGSLSLSVVAKTQGFFRREDQRRREAGEQTLSLEAKKDIIGTMIGATDRECERKLVSISPESAIPQEKIRALSQDKTLVSFVSDSGLMEKLEKLKGLLAHQNYDGKMDQLIEILADLALKKLDPEKKPPAQNKEGLLPAPVSPPRQTRYIRAEVKREVQRRDSNRCSYVDPKTGRRCESRHGLQLDHAHPYAWGGQNTVENLRLRCGVHNRYEAEKLGLFRPQ